MPDPVFFQNITVYRNLTISGWKDGDKHPISRSSWNQIWNLTKEAMDWLYNKINLEASQIRQPSQKITGIISQKIAGIDWKKSEKNRLSCWFESRLFPKAGFLQLGLKLKGSFTASEFILLQSDLAYQPFSEKQESKILQTFVIGENYYFAAEVKSDIDLSNTALKIITDELIVLHPSDRIAIIDYPWGTIAIPRDQQSPVVILSHENSKNTKDKEQFIHTVLSRLALYSDSITKLYQNYRNIYPLIKSSAVNLAQALIGSAQSETVEGLENRIEVLSQKFDELVEHLSLLKQIKIAMESNLIHLNRVLLDPVLNGKKNILWEIYGEKSQLQIDLLTENLEYFQTRIEEAQFTLKVLQSLVNVEQAKFQRNSIKKQDRNTLNLGVIATALAIVEGFGSFLSDEVKFQIFFSGITFVFLPIIWEKFKDKFNL